MCQGRRPCAQSCHVSDIWKWKTELGLSKAFKKQHLVPQQQCRSKQWAKSLVCACDWLLVRVGKDRAWNPIHPQPVLRASRSMTLEKGDGNARILEKLNQICKEFSRTLWRIFIFYLSVNARIERRKHFCRISCDGASCAATWLLAAVATYTYGLVRRPAYSLVLYINITTVCQGDYLFSSASSTFYYDGTSRRPPPTDETGPSAPTTWWKLTPFSFLFLSFLGELSKDFASHWDGKKTGYRLRPCPFWRDGGKVGFLWCEWAVHLGSPNNYPRLQDAWSSQLLMSDLMVSRHHHPLTVHRLHPRNISLMPTLNCSFLSCIQVSFQKTPLTSSSCFLYMEALLYSFFNLCCRRKAHISDLFIVLVTWIH